MTRSRQQRSLSFGAEAAAYERGRPSYPPEAIDWLLPTNARDVLDLGAGTGKLTTRLVERGLDVVAVDPIPEMLELLTDSLPDTPALLGTAEDIPLPDDSVDAVLVAQAWHWFDPERAIKEVARVLRPGGRLGLVWNTRDERMGWVKDLGRIIGHEDDPFNHEVPLAEPFDEVERSTRSGRAISPRRRSSTSSHPAATASRRRQTSAPRRSSGCANCSRRIPRLPTPTGWRCRTSR